ncbi:serine hydrolase [Nocardia sp. NPDC003482]
MNGKVRWLGLAGCALALSVSGHLVTVTAHARNTETASGAEPTLRAAAQQGPALVQQIRSAIETASPGTVSGIDVVDTETGAELAALDADRQFYTASVVKLLIAIDAIETSGESVDADRIRQMLSASDDSAADALWEADGGADIVRRTAALLGLDGTAPPDDPAQWGQTRTTPRDVVTIYRYLTTAAPPFERALILDALGSVSEIAADGTDEFFGIPAALPGADWFVKPGWMTLDSSTTLNSTGLVGPPDDPQRYAVVVLTTQPAGTGWDAGGAALTAGISALAALVES